MSGQFYGFLISRDGRVQQVQLGDRDSDGLIDGQLVRSFDVGGEAEGCVADDSLGHFYVSEEDVGIWKYGAEPSASPSSRIRVDSVGAGGHLAADVEGLTIVYQPGGTGYLMASAQNVASPTNNYSTIYERQGANTSSGASRWRPARSPMGAPAPTASTPWPPPWDRASPRDCSSARTTRTRLRGRQGTRTSSSCGWRRS